jgi:endoglucanase
MQDIKNLLHGLLAIPAPSGFEGTAGAKLAELFGDIFDEHMATPSGNHIFIKRCGKTDAPRFLLDAHFDTIGFMVTEIMDSGHLRVINLGGIDRRSLVAAQVTIYANEQIPAVITAPPAVVMSDGDAKKLPAVNECFVFTGLSADELHSRGVRIGTTILYNSPPLELAEGMISTAGMDNRISAAALVHAVQLLKDENLLCDIFVLLSSTEEVANQPGAKTGAYTSAPTAAIIVDVDFGHTPDSDRAKCSDLGKGAVITRSIETSRTMTNALIKLAKDKEIAHQPSMEAMRTGTNNASVAFSRSGVPSALIGIPLRNMHTMNEVAMLSDVSAVAKLIAEYIKTFGGAAI